MTDRGAEDGSVGRICRSYCLPNSDNGYTVLNLVAGEEEITCVGTLPFLGEGELIQARGHYTEHATYGDQFVIESYEEKQPETRWPWNGIWAPGPLREWAARWLPGSCARFGADTFRIIEREPERLAEIKGISERKAREIAGQVEEKKDMREAMIFLQQYGISTALAVKIYQKYGTEIYRVIRENPYRMADDLEGVGFRIADEIARRAGIQADFGFPCQKRYFFMCCSRPPGRAIFIFPGKNCSPEPPSCWELCRKIWMTAAGYGGGAQDYPPVRGRTGSGLCGFSYYLELNTAKMLHDLNVTGEIDREKVMEKIRRIEKKKGTVLDEKQREAVMECSAVRSDRADRRTRHRENHYDQYDD